MQLVDRDALLLHRVAETDGDAIINQRVVIDCDTVRRTDGILATITLAN